MERINRVLAFVLILTALAILVLAFISYFPNTLCRTTRYQERETIGTATLSIINNNAKFNVTYYNESARYDQILVSSKCNVRLEQCPVYTFVNKTKKVCL